MLPGTFGPLGSLSIKVLLSFQGAGQGTGTSAVQVAPCLCARVTLAVRSCYEHSGLYCDCITKWLRQIYEQMTMHMWSELDSVQQCGQGAHHANTRTHVYEWPHVAHERMTVFVSVWGSMCILKGLCGQTWTDKWMTMWLCHRASGSTWLSWAWLCSTVSQRLIALLYPGRDRMQALRSASIPSLHMRSQNRLFFQGWAKIGNPRVPHPHPRFW